MNLDKLITIYNTMRQISVNGDNVKLMNTCLVNFEEFFKEIQIAQAAAAAEKSE